MKLWRQNALYPQDIEYIFCASKNDPTFIELVHNLKNAQMTSKMRLRILECDKVGSAPAWNFGAQHARGDLLVQGQDDVEPPLHWDMRLFEKLMNHEFESVFIAVSDGYRKDQLCCTAIMNRARMQQEGHFLFPGYQSVYSDDEVTYRAIRDSRAGLCTLIDAREIVFIHRHHYHDASVPMDATYEHENSAEAYRIGGALFAQRNPEAATDGIRNWG